MLSTLPNFDELRDLHKCANDLLHSPQIQQALNQQETTSFSVREISEATLEMLDVCSTTREIHVLVKEHLQELQHTLRRAKIEVGGSDFEAQMSAHGLYRKKLNKELAKCLRNIKGKTLLSLLSLPTTISIVHSQRSLSSSLASKFRRVNCQRLLERCDSMEVRMANKRLEEVEKAMEDVEVELDCIIRRFIHTRVLLLNIMNN
ncbi:DNA ligase [Bienertia sinuspersici]